MTRQESTATRRSLLAACGAAGTLLAGCLESGGGPEVDVVTADGDGGRVYVPPHVHGRRIAGTQAADDYRLGLAYSVPDFYWTVDGATTTEVTLDDDENVQLVGYVWTPDGDVLPGVGLDATLHNGGEQVAERRLSPLLSQRWGLYHGANLSLGTYTEYEVELRVSGTDVRRTRDYDGAFADPASATVPFDFDRGTMDDIGTTFLDAANEPGAVAPAADGDLPLNRSPDPDSLPGSVVASGRSGDAALTVLALAPDRSPLADGDPYLAVLATTPYNDLWLPAMEVMATLTDGDETVHEGPLAETLDPELGHHYGTSVAAIDDGAALALSFPTSPQVGRREGYEEAFLNLPGVELTVSR